MRALSALLLCLPIALPAMADEIYREVRPDGSVHYTDRPADKRARPLRFGPASGTTPGKAARGGSAFYTPEMLKEAARFAVRVESPTPGQSHAAGRPLIAAASVMPGLVQGFRLVYQVDGVAVHAAPVDELSFALPPMAAGTHELIVVLLNPQGQEVARSAPTEFRLASLPAMGRSAQKEGNSTRKVQ